MLTEGGAISTVTTGLGNAGNIRVENAHDILINGVNDTETWINANGVQVNGQFSGFYLNTQGAGNGGSLNLTTDHLTLSDGGIISAIALSKTSTDKTVTGNIHINADTIALNTGGLIATTTSNAASAGPITINAAQSLTISGLFDRNLHPDITNPRESDHSGILSNASHALDPTAEKLGAAGNVTVHSPLLMVSEGGLISTATEGAKEAGNINVDADVLAISASTISAEATAGSSGQTGDINIHAHQLLQLANQGKITIQNHAVVANPAASKAGVIMLSAPELDLKDSSITAASTGNVDAGSIVANFSHALMMDSAFITTSATDGNGGTISINGGELINLQNSGFLTSVSGANGNGGNINVAADILVTNTGVIQANALGGKGGDIGLNLKALIPSHDVLIKGGLQVLWQPSLPGFNVIQAASATGVSGNINLTSPQFNISGSISGLDAGSLVLPVIKRNTCQAVASGSSLANGGKGGLPANEAKTGFIPIATELDAGAGSNEVLLNPKPSAINPVKPTENYPCVD
jgi:hypothetical protein